MDNSRLKYTDHSMLQRTGSNSGAEYMHYPLQYEGLPEEAKEYAQGELNETKENKKEGIKKLKEFMLKESLTCPDDNMLVAVLRNCKYDISKSESKLKKFLKTRQLIIKEMYQMDMKKIQLVLDQLTVVLLPWRIKHGGIICYSRPRQEEILYDTDEYVFCYMVQVLYMLQFPLSSIYGVCHIGDYATPYYDHLTIFNVVRRSHSLVVNMPYRFARIDISNESFLSRLFLNLLTPLLPKKLKKRMMCHGSDMESLHKFYHPDLLPVEIGGTLGPLSDTHYREDLLMFIKKLRDEYLENLSTDL